MEWRDWERKRSRTAESFQEEREMILIYYRQTQEGNYTTFLMTVFLSLTLMVVIKSILQIWWEGAVLGALLPSGHGEWREGGLASPNRDCEAWKFSFIIRQIHSFL